MPQITFLTVKNSTAKLECVSAVVQQHFVRRRRVLITVPNAEAAKYVDQLLWGTPKEGFVPHVCAEEPLKDAVVITTQLQNLNEAEVLLNLRPEMSPFCKQFDYVIELIDMTHPTKEALSRKKMEEYKAAGFPLKYEV